MNARQHCEDANHLMLTSQQLRDVKAASGKLAVFMRPHVFVKVFSFPMTRNNKLSRNELPSPRPEDIAVSMSTGHHTQVVQPKTISEERIIAVFQTIFNLPSDFLSMNYDFCKLGGNSSDAMAITVYDQTTRRERLFKINSYRR